MVFFACKALALIHLDGMVLPGIICKMDNPPVLPDDTNEHPTTPYGYWFFYRILRDYIKADMDGSFDRTPSNDKYRRVLELVAGPNYKSKARLVELLSEIAGNPAENPIKQRARDIMNDIYQRQIRDADLDRYEFHEE